MLLLLIIIIKCSFEGSIGGSEFAEDELWLFDMNISNNSNHDNQNNNNNSGNDKEIGKWKLIKIKKKLLSL